MNTTKLSFAYLYYTVSEYTGYTPLLLGVFKSSKVAKTHLDLVNGEYVPVNSSNGVGGSLPYSLHRVLQKLNNSTGQIWYVEKHVMRDPAHAGG
jgi:hypothetical protein